MLERGKVNANSVVTGTVGLAGVSAAFEALEHPGRHAKIVIASELGHRSRVSVRPPDRISADSPGH